MIVKSIYPDIEPIVGLTVPEFIWSRLEKWSNATCLECGITGKKWTYQEVFDQSRSFGAALIKNGLKKGDTVALLLPNCPEYAIALFGTWEAGCIATPTNPAYTKDEICHQIGNSEAKFIVTNDAYIHIMKQAKECISGLENVCIIDSGSASCEEFLKFSEMIQEDSTGVDFAKGCDMDTTQTVAVLPYSSGTTGLPKGVMLTHSNICTNLWQHVQPDIASVKAFEGGQEQEIQVGILPFFHVYGLAVILICGMYQGCKTICLPKFQPASFLKVVRESKPTLLHLVTPLINFVVNSPDFGTEEFESIHTVLAGATPVGLTLIKSCLEKAGKYIFFQEGYGMTELSPMSHVINPSSQNTKIGSIGRLVPSTEAMIIDIETEKALGPNQNGEIWIRGPQVMTKGYLKNEQATKNTVDSLGFLHTGDVGYYDEDGYFYICDRIKELIKVKGFQVAPSELEDLLLSHPDIKDAAVIGVPGKKDDEVPRAYIIRSSESLLEPDVHNFLEGKIAAFKKLVGGVEFVETIPRAASGKILRRELLKIYKEKCPGA